MKAGYNPDGTKWNIVQWKEHARAELAKPIPENISKVDAAVRRSMQTISEAPDSFTAEQTHTLLQYMAASVMAAAVPNIMKKPEPKA